MCHIKKEDSYIDKMDLDSLTEAFYRVANDELVNLNKITTKETENQLRNAILRKFRINLEPFVFNYLIMRYGEKLDLFWKIHQFPKKSQYAWVLVERRIHSNFWFVLRNLAWAGPDMSLYIFCSDHNISYIKSILGDKVENVHLISVFTGEGLFQEATDDYQRIFKKAEFYRQIDAEYMLKIELDCYLRRPLPKQIFVDDFYGAPWAWMLDKPGGGGLNVRRVPAMIELCDKLNDANTVPEDGWLGQKIVELGYRVPPLDFRVAVFSENFPVKEPIGVHQFWTFVLNFGFPNKAKLRENIERYLTIHI
jgi:hypothetical protein